MAHPKVLVVDNDAEYCRLLCSLLRLEGFDAVSAESGSKALELINNQNFALLITDFNMPEMDGLMLAATVNEYRPTITIFIMTGDVFSDVINNALNAGISNVFTKPLDLKKLLAAIRQQLICSNTLTIIN